VSPQRIQMRRAKGWRKPPGVVVVARGTDWGNPFRVGSVVTLDGPGLPDGLPPITVGRRLAVELYRAYVTDRGWVGQIRAELAGKDLGCWCSPDQPCHADVLLQIANEADPAGGAR
jgi:hypothetical protein